MTVDLIVEMWSLMNNKNLTGCILTYPKPDRAIFNFITLYIVLLPSDLYCGFNLLLNALDVTRNRRSLDSASDILRKFNSVLEYIPIYRE